MYAFVDRHPSTLGNAGRFVLWAMRGWTAAVANKSCPPRTLFRGFNGMGASAALPDFHIANALLHRDALTRLQFAQVNCCRIHENEAVLLSLWNATGQGNSALVMATLGRLVREESVQPVTRAMASCTMHLLLAGIDLTETLTTPIEN
jgi:hypothetical protein